MGSEVCDKSLSLGFGDAQIWHQDPLLDALGVPNPASQIFVGVLEGAGGDVRTGTHVCQIRAHHSLGGIDRLERVAPHAALGHEQLLATGIVLTLGPAWLVLLERGSSGGSPYSWGRVTRRRGLWLWPRMRSGLW